MDKQMVLLLSRYEELLKHVFCKEVSLKPLCVISREIEEKRAYAREARKSSFIIMDNNEHLQISSMSDKIQIISKSKLWINKYMADNDPLTPIFGSHYKKHYLLAINNESSEYSSKENNITDLEPSVCDVYGCPEMGDCNRASLYQSLYYNDIDGRVYTENALRYINPTHKDSARKIQIIHIPSPPLTKLLKPLRERCSKPKDDYSVCLPYEDGNIINEKAFIYRRIDSLRMHSIITNFIIQKEQLLKLILAHEAEYIKNDHGWDIILRIPTSLRLNHSTGKRGEFLRSCLIQLRHELNMGNIKIITRSSKQNEILFYLGDYELLCMRTFDDMALAMIDIVTKYNQLVLLEKDPVVRADGYYDITYTNTGRLRNLCVRRDRKDISVFIK